MAKTMTKVSSASVSNKKRRILFSCGNVTDDCGTDAYRANVSYDSCFIGHFSKRRDKKGG